MIENLASGNGHEKDKHTYTCLFKDILDKIILAQFCARLSLHEIVYITPRIHGSALSIYLQYECKRKQLNHSIVWKQHRD